MAYRFRARDRTITDAARHIVREQIDGAIDAVDSRDAATAIHEMRKCCKKVRALLRLIRPAFPDYAQENTEFRDIARSLAGSRDAKVLLDTFDLIVENPPEGTSTELFAPLRRQIARDKAKETHGGEAETNLKKASRLLGKARKRGEAWIVQSDGWDALGEGLGRIVREARKAERTVHAEPSALNYHELRKLMKYHWYHTRLLVPIWPELMAPRAAELSRLADLLGLHHDICVFEEWLGAALTDGERFDAIEAILPLTGNRRRQVEHEIRPLVGRMLAQRPSELVDQWQMLWQIWRGETENESR